MIEIIQDTIGTLTAIYQFIISLPGTISTIVLYPIQAGLQMIVNIGSDFIGHVTGPIGPMIQLQTGAFGLVTAVISNLYPMAWIGLIGTGFATIAIIRLYHFAKDLEIAGFKI